MKLRSFISLLVTSLTIGTATAKESPADFAARAFEDGSALLSKGNAQGSLSLLAAAARIQPENDAYHLQLARAQSATKNYGEAWVSLRNALRVGETNPAAAEEFMGMWQVFERKGLFNVGNLPKDIESALGKPDETMGTSPNLRFVYGFMAIDFKSGQLFQTLDLRGLTNEAFNPPQELKVSIDRKKWHVTHHSINQTEDHVVAVPKGDTFHSWSEMFSRQRFHHLRKDGLKPRQVMNNVRTSLTKAHPDVEWITLSESADSVLYHWRIKASNGQPAQHEISRILKGERDMFRVGYVKLTDKLSAEELVHWTTALNKAALVAPKS